MKLDYERNRMKRVAMVDLDNTLLDTGQSILNVFIERGLIPKSEKVHNLVSYRIEENYFEISAKDVADIFKESYFWLNIPLITGATHFMNWLCQSYDEVHIATDRFWYEGIKKDTEWNLGQAGIKYTHLEIIESKNKAEYCRNIGATVAFEDRPDNAKAISAVCPVGLIPYAYNDPLTFDTGGLNIFRCSDEQDLPSLSVATNFAEYIYAQSCRQKFDTVLDEAKHLVYGDRQGQYTHPLDNFSLIADLWSAYTGHPFYPDDVALMQGLVKVARAKAEIDLGRDVKNDTIADLAGYAETLNMVIKERNARISR